MTGTVAWALRGARDQTLRLAAGLPDATGTEPGDSADHSPAWILGHLLLADTYLLHLLDGSPLPAVFPDLLSRYGPAAMRNAAARLDPVADLVERLAETGARRDATLASMDPTALDRPTPDSNLAGSQPTIGHHLAALVCHEGYHAGELAGWRRRLALPAVRWSFAPPG